MYYANQSMQLQIDTAQDMQSLGAKFAGACRAGQNLVIFLHGDLGTGKTTFAQGFLLGLGHRGRVKSPTYTLLEPYQTALHTVYHLDLYRLADPEELEYLGLRDYLGTPALWLVEWPERGEGWLPAADVAAAIQHAGTGRRVTLTPLSPAGEETVRMVSANAV